MSSGLNTDVEYRGRVYHVQTEDTTRRGRAVETLIFQSGEILVRMTAAFPDTESQEAVETQHWDLVRKIRNGMLDDNERQAPEERPEVRQLLSELDHRLDEIFVEQAAPPDAPRPKWWERHLGRVSVVVRFWR